jgi:glutamate/tyrosine decarboxylase-like PLP-dependent enzyme
MKSILKAASECASNFIASLPDRPVAPSPSAIGNLDRLGGPLPDKPSDPLYTLALLDEVGSPATVASAGPRYFGFVIGGSLPAALAANWLAGAWDQNSAMQIMSPIAARLEEIVLSWTLELLNLPSGCGGGFVTGTTAANFTALAAARTALLARSGWNVEEDGLFGAPPIHVVVGDEVHVSLLKALSILGLGRKRVTRVRVDDQGRMRADLLPQLDDRTLVCIQAGNVNTGAFDPAAEICARARDANAWVHVDGAFGLWAALSPQYAPLLDGAENADSWAIDCHKWLNVPYDSGMAVVRDPNHLKAAMSLSAAYLAQSEKREPWHFVPESSRRVRGVELWAAMHSLGRSGLCELVERNCRQARLFATRLEAAGFAILNDVILNQVLVSFGTPDQTRQIIAAIQAEGTCWCGGTEWQGHTAMRISVSNWSTTDDDVERSAAAMIRVARKVLSNP